MSDLLANRSRREWLQLGEAICRGRDWRWVALWAYNIHRLLRGVMQERDIWRELDGLIRREWDWHLGRDLFQSIREVTLRMEQSGPDPAEYAYLVLGEVTAKCISNASWDPGLFDIDVAWAIPGIALDICERRQNAPCAEFLAEHFSSLSRNRYADHPTGDS